ncbi:DUF3866 family protein [Actinomarinicola tropica]|uniref:DUF3866 family protein n=1 Tax=Actinomarinicola tropica TaxID=2789776 RepID=A0A5Q2RHN2_9ACTN|nr:DUF3866 family protein [Actinomarinicola tropica]QGG95293.1 DUF3866 family protein [Actinomarinicola tropica]
MPSFRTGTVVEVLSERRGIQRLTVDLGGPAPERAYALVDLVGPVAPGDGVVVNTTAVDLGLGTGGWHVVHWNLARESWSRPGPGHIVKLRYTSLQADVGAAEEAHPDLPATLDGTPVVACGLHSQVGVVAASIAAARPGTRVAYVMTDGAALPLALSDLVGALVDAGLVHTTVTTGHAIGGDLEAVSLPSALVLARHVAGAEVVVVGMGPGVVGTGTALGTTGVEVASIVDAAAALGGRPVVCARASDGDARQRHRGLSHHTVTALGLARTAADVAVARGSGLEVPPPHRQVEVEVPDVAALLDDLDLRITTMGRGPDADPLFFRTASAAGIVATGLLDGGR